MQILFENLDLVTTVLLSVYILRELLYMEIRRLPACAVLSGLLLAGNIVVYLLCGDDSSLHVIYFHAACFFGGTFFLCKVFFVRAAFYSFLSTMIFSSIERLIQDLLLVLFDLMSISVPDFLVNLATLTLTCLLFLVSIPFFKQRFTNESHRVSIKFFSFISMTSFVNFVIYYLCRQCFYITDFAYFANKARCKIFLLLFALCLILELFALLYLYFEKTHSTIIQDFTKEYLTLERKHFEQLQQKEEDTKKFRHDIKNHLFILQQYSHDRQYDLLDSYLNTMNQDFFKTQQAYKTGFFAIDSLLNQKADVLSEAEITVSIDSEASAPCQIDDFSLVTIFSNAFSNAIEACQNLPGAKEISILIRCTDRQFAMEMKNPVKHRISIHHNHIHTTKAEAHLHSFGLPQIEKTVQLLHGTFLLECTDDVFTLSVSVQNRPASY